MNKYEKLKKWVISQGLEIPLSIEPYTDAERETRNRLPRLYWTQRDYDAYQQEKKGFELNDT